MMATITMFFTESLTKLGQSFLTIFIESAPWLLFGFFIAGLIKALIPTDFLQKHLGDNSVMAVIKGAFIGAPLPLCSCGVIPAALGLYRSGASKPATTAFLIATPETGADSVSATYALLGPFMAIIRPIAAVSTAIVAGLMVLFFDKPKSISNRQPLSTDKDTNSTSCCSVKEAPKQSSCCSSANDLKQSAQSSCCASKQSQSTESSSCCDTKTQTQPITFVTKIKSGLSFAFFDLLKDISMWLLIGLILAAFILAFVPPSFLATWGASPYAYLLMAIIGVPMYICATSSTPIAAGLLFAGVSPGAILVFLLVGPATNIATVSLVKQELGKTNMYVYITSIAVMAFVFGALTDWLSVTLNIQTVSPVSLEHAHTGLIAILSSVVLALLIVNALWQKYVR
ncbi:SO_0444 family Cu/Zn efflux transporter [Psychrobacter sp. HD31]|uniref:SO_0444 family Cu/Zn efflux transporter n=1 Tax=Psychrobacter sp. HD31 TaxID=3112003 RepID=UPI003DA2B1C7